LSNEELELRLLKNAELDFYGHKFKCLTLEEIIEIIGFDTYASLTSVLSIDKNWILNVSLNMDEQIPDEIVEKIVIFEDGKIEADFYIPFVDTIESTDNIVENIDVSVIGYGGVGDTTTLKNITVHLPLHSKMQDNQFEWVDSIYSNTRENLMAWASKKANIKNAFVLHKQTGISHPQCLAFFKKTSIPSRESWLKIATHYHLSLNNFIKEFEIDVNPDNLYSIIEFVNQRPKGRKLCN
jgi:hypothetical protein